MGKRWFYTQWLSKTFVKPLLIFDVVFALVAIAGGFVIWRWPQFGGTMNFLLWAIPGTILVVGLIIGFIYAPYLIYKSKEEEANKSANELATLKTKQPRMRCVETENVQAPLYNKVTGEVMGIPCFTHAIFANDPELSTKGDTAQKVVGHIEFYENSRRKLLFTMVGRWSETPERADVGIRVVETNQIDIAPNAIPRSLDIVLKYDDEDECYGLNNETPVRAPSGWRDTTRKLDVKTYAVKIRLRGTNVDEVFWFQMTNPGKGNRVELEAVT